MSAKRINEIKSGLKKENLDGFIVTHLDHVRYLCGYTGSNGLLVIGNGKTQFLTDFRYADQAKNQVKGATVNVMSKGDLIGALKEFPQLNRKNLRYGYSESNLSVAGGKRLQAALPDALLVPGDAMIAELGWVKEKLEIDLIAKACKIGDTALERVLQLVAPGVTERELQAELEYQMAMLGSERPSFETIIASGYRSAMPHGMASNKKIQAGDFVTFDFGATVNGYVSDMTRTIVVGKATAKQKKIYGIVLRSQMAGVKTVKAGVVCRKVDEACRKIITRAGYGKEFGHGTGHGIGFPYNPIHTGPHVSPISEEKLQVNNVITVEPGIYISGWGGVRIEDDVVVTRNGCKVLTHFPKNLLEV
ncbi:MAG TPA: Xaa-Pro peptidase family protein [candidate division Zixibacteria bacterium]|nr:Xaa-Pro peptidase family protein [candidate division Zixibacteria bacterium]